MWILLPAHSNYSRYSSVRRRRYVCLTPSCFRRGKITGRKVCLCNSSQPFFYETRHLVHERMPFYQSKFYQSRFYQSCALGWNSSPEKKKIDYRKPPIQSVAFIHQTLWRSDTCPFKSINRVLIKHPDKIDNPNKNTSSSDHQQSANHNNRLRWQNPTISVTIKPAKETHS